MNIEDMSPADAMREILKLERVWAHVYAAKQQTMDSEILTALEIAERIILRKQADISEIFKIHVPD